MSRSRAGSHQARLRGPVWCPVRLTLLFSLLSIALLVGACSSNERIHPDHSDGRCPCPSERGPSEPDPMEPEPTDPTEPEPSEPEPSEPEPTEPEPIEPPLNQYSPSLRGDPSFDASRLSGEAAAWHGSVIETIAYPGSDLDPLYLAGSDDVFGYGRPLHTYVQSVLFAFRLTGDLELLDHVDVIAERMRAELHDSWRGTKDGTDGTSDGYLNWVWRYSDGDRYVGKDTHMMDDMKTHAMIAMIAVALDMNRDLVSPGGRDYAAHADFWQDYLVNHFEAKWRERQRKPTGFPIMTHRVMHAYLSWAKWHYYMGVLTGDAAYTNEASRMANHWWAEMRTIATPSGPGYVYPQTVLGLGGTSNILMPTVYASMVFADVVEMHFEGFDRWASAEELRRFARTFAEIVLDTDDPVANGYSQCIGGGVERAGLPTYAANLVRGTANRYALSGFPHIAAWDASKRVADFTNDAHDAVSGTGMMLESGALLSSIVPRSALRSVDF